MPELPEVETMRRGILPVVGGTITSVRRPPCKLKPIRLEPGLAALRRRLVGRQIEGVGRVGKRVVLELADGRLVLEPRMTGLVLLTDPPNLEHLRLRLGLEGAPVPELLYWDRRGLGSVRWFSLEGFRAAFSPPVLGPDALTITTEQLRAQLGRSARAIKPALLDQKALAGVGNIYASESLFVAKIHPERACVGLSAREWRSLRDAVVSILEEAIRYEGSTLSDGTYRNALNSEGNYQQHHRVYARADERCKRCRRGRIRRTVLAQRATFHCPVCQRPRSA